MGPNVTITKRGPGAKEIQDKLAAVTRMEVLVGIPQATAEDRHEVLRMASRFSGKTTQSMRKRLRIFELASGSERVNNAQLMYIHTHGSPARRIPARPVIEPAIAADGNRQAIAAQLKQAVKAQMDGNSPAAIRHMRLAGTEGASAAKRWFVDPRNNWAPNAPGTIRRKGSDRPLIDTGALRRSITWVIRGQ